MDTGGMDGGQTSFDEVRLDMDKASYEKNGNLRSSPLESCHSDEDDGPDSRTQSRNMQSCTALSLSRDSQDSYLRTTLAFIFLFYNMTLNLFVLAVVHERVPTHIHQPLPDIAFDALPKADWALDVAEYIIVAQVAAVLFTLFLHRYR